jgi:hypothetical protein
MNLSFWRSFGLPVMLSVGFVCSLVAVPNQAQAKFLVDATLGEVKAEDKVKVAEPRPVQLLFEFQTDGVPNAKAVKFVLPIVTKELQATGVVGTISNAPVDGSDLLSIVFNNITEKGAASKGFKTGLTFGLAGTVVQDNYEVQFRYTHGSGEPIARTIHHRLYTKLGAKQDPENAVPMKNAEAAIQTIVHQVIAQGMNQIAGDPAFAPAPAAAAPVVEAAAEPAAVAAPAAAAAPAP